MNEGHDAQHPEFERPPVVEVALGIEFVPLASWGIPHFGLFWQRVRESFPRFEVKEPIVQPGRALSGVWPVRCWFLNQSGAQLLQLQDDRLVLNWRRVGTEQYPRYATMRPQLDSLWASFTSFLEDESIEMPQVQQCEFTYVNHLDFGAVLGGSRRMADAFSFWEGGPTQFLEEAGTVAFNGAFSTPDSKGQVTVSFQPAVQIADPKPIAQLTISTRIRPETSRASAILDGLDQGHNWSVRSFLEFTTEKAQKMWGRRGLS